MVCDCIKSGQKTMTIPVVILGIGLCTVLLSYLVFGDSTDHEGLRTLRMVSIVFRHGDRTPTDLYPNDPYLHNEFPGGLGALTEKGSNQMYNLGKNLRLRYYRLLPSNGLYSQNDMNIRSSYAERCIMSAQSFMAGFLPPLDSHNPLPIPWQPIGITVIPRSEDILIAQKKPCPKYDETLRRLYTNPTGELKELNDKNAILYAKLTKNTGKNISNLNDIEFLYNTLEIEKNFGLILPDWTESIFPEKLLPLAERNLALLTETPFMKKIKGGALITDVIDNMVRKRLKILSPNRSIFVYSGHDITLVNVMRSLGVLEETSRKPDYASALVFELHHSVIYDDDFEVKLVYYFNGEDRFPKEIEIPKCPDPCSLTNFVRVMSSVTVKNYDELCELIER